MSGLFPDRLVVRPPDSPGSTVFDLPVNLNPASYVTTPATQTAHPERRSTPRRRAHDDMSFVVISGGSGCNSICAAFGDAAYYVLPVSDDGGSSSEIIRVLGGPSIGDIRSRLVRLIPTKPGDSPVNHIKKLLAYRLSQRSPQQAREEWKNIVEGNSALWSGIPADRKEVIRGFLVYFESEILRRAHKNFSFQNGSIGNYFLAAAQSFFRSLPSAIFLFSSITGSQANIIPVLVTNHTVTISVELESGAQVVGQCNISHPVGTLSGAAPQPPPALVVGNEEDAGGGQNLVFEKEQEIEYATLGSRIKRLFYINPYGHEIFPVPNPEFIKILSTQEVLVYACGSLWTSIVPCLALNGVATAIVRSQSLKAKVLLLNSKTDRETEGQTALDFVMTIARTLDPLGEYPVSAFVTHLVHLKEGEILVDNEALTGIGVRCVETEPRGVDKSMFDEESVSCAMEKVVQDVAYLDRT